MPLRLRHLYAFPALLLYAAASFGQSYSIDGQRWYEVEITIFTNQSLGSLNTEVAEPFNTSLTYPNLIRDLQAASDSFAFEFELEQTLDELPQQTLPSRRANLREELREELRERFTPTLDIGNDLDTIDDNLGPEYSPGTTDFKVADSNFDPFIHLNPGDHQFININQRINRSQEHRVLYHAVWRQPMLSKNQSSAVFIKGGDQYGDHSELEGSITLSYNVNRIDADVNLWRNTFTPATDPSPWLVPPPAFIDNEDADIELMIEEVAQMQEVRQMISNNIHYLDHPAFGLIIEVRPYLLPTPLDE